MESEEWKKRYLEANAKQIGSKKQLPLLRGLITEYQGKTQVGLWATEEFEKLIKKIMKDIMNGA
jgi:hypothetical protein